MLRIVTGRPGGPAALSGDHLYRPLAGDPKGCGGDSQDWPLEAASQRRAGERRSHAPCARRDGPGHYPSHLTPSQTWRPNLKTGQWPPCYPCPHWQLGAGTGPDSEDVHLGDGPLQWHAPAQLP